MHMLQAVDKAGKPPQSIEEIRQLFQVVEPLLRQEGTIVAVPPTPTSQATQLMAGLGEIQDLLENRNGC